MPLKAWGIDCLQKLNGPFAFAIYDKSRHELYLCRDRFGKKPLFYQQRQEDLYFASSATALANELNLKPNLEYAAQGLHYWVYEDMSDQSPYIGLKALLAGHYLKVNFQSNRCELKKYYDLSKITSENTETLCMDTNNIIERVNATLIDAVKIRLRADVPLAISLSGGLDSTTIADIVTRDHKNMQGFTFGDPSLAYTEAPLVHQFTQQQNMHVNYVYPNPEEFANALLKTIAIQDGPFASLSIVAQFLVYELAHKTGIKVLLGGQGGDEAFMGYRKFHIFQIKQLKQEKRYLQLLFFLFQFQSLLLAEKHRLKQFWKQRSRYQQDQTNQNTILDLPSINTLNLGAKGNIIERQIADVTRFSLPTLLRYEDRNSMGNSIESRLPFMDHRLIELGMALPVALKLKKGYGKWILREITANKIPNSIRLARYKRGFDVSMGHFIKAGLGGAIRQALYNQDANIKNYLCSTKPIEQIFSDQELSQNQQRVAEAITLLWLGNL